MRKASLKKGTYQLHPLPMFNYQLNRAVMWNSCSETDIKEVSSQVGDFSSWEQSLVKLSENAQAQGQLAAASGYLRMAEFFMDSSTPAARAINTKAKELFYEHYQDLFGGDAPAIKKTYIPYENGELPCWRLASQQPQQRGTILFHGGHDSLIEEFLDSFLYLSENGFDVIAFEGPGQGEALRGYGLTFTSQWEKPVSCVLDYFDVTAVTIIGVSLGGMLAPRAAAFDKRIKKVVAWSILPSMYDCLMYGKPAELVEKLEMLVEQGEGDKVNAIYEELGKKSPLVKWSVDHCNFAYGTSSVYEYLQVIKEYSMKPIANRITQDFLLIGARQDHMADFSQCHREIDWLCNPHTFTFMAFGNEADAGTHCNVGNMKLVLDAIIQWHSWLSREND